LDVENWHFGDKNMSGRTLKILREIEDKLRRMVMPPAARGSAPARSILRTFQNL
jgi:hypothetical protein